MRTLDDSRALIAKAEKSKKAVIVGASFIGLEVASSLSARGLEIHVVGPEAIPMARVLGPELGSFIRSVHELHGVTFHLGRTAVSIDEHAVTLDNGARIDTDLVVVGIGVRPATALAEQAGLTIDRGVLVDQFLETSAPGVFAAGDIARWPDPHSGEAIRVEHFVVAERQGQTAARNMLGRREAFDAVPFFWTEQHDFGIAYVGHSEKWDEIVIDGSIVQRDCAISYLREGRKQAVAVMHRDHEGLLAEVEFERAIGRPDAAARPPASLRRSPKSSPARSPLRTSGSSGLMSRPRRRTAHESSWIACGRAESARWKPDSTNGSRRSRQAPSCVHGSAMTRDRWDEFRRRYRAELAAAFRNTEGSPPPCPGGPDHPRLFGQGRGSQRRSCPEGRHSRQEGAFQ